MTRAAGYEIGTVDDGRRVHTCDDRGPYLQVGPHGRAFYLLDPKPKEVHLEDIAYSLAKLCRYNGHCIKPYSVAEHSILVSRIVNHKLAKWALLHDAEEAYTGDLTRSMKTALEIIAPGAFKRISKPIAMAIATRFKIGWPEPEEVKTADCELLALEVEENMPTGPCEWHNMHEPPRGIHLKCWGAKVAERQFHLRARELMLIEY